MVGLLPPVIQLGHLLLPGLDLPEDFHHLTQLLPLTAVFLPNVFGLHVQSLEDGDGLGQLLQGLLVQLLHPAERRSGHLKGKLVWLAEKTADEIEAVRVKLKVLVVLLDLLNVGEYMFV